MKKIIILSFFAASVLFLVFSSSTSAQSATIVVNSPNSSSQWPAGSFQTVNWTASGIFDLYQNYIQILNSSGSPVYGAFGVVGEDWQGQKSITIPAELQPGFYKIRVVIIYDRSNNMVIGFSNQFQITTPTPATAINITITSPTAATVWQSNVANNITWTSSNWTIPSTVDIRIFRSSDNQLLKEYTGLPGMTVESGSFPIPANDLTAGSYFILVDARAVAPPHYRIFLSRSDIFTVETPQLSITSSSPPDGAIDARNVNPVKPSFRDVALTFSGSAAGVTAADFTVLSSSTSAPSILNVAPSGNNNATLTLSRPLNTQERVKITYTPSGDKVCLGFLPGNVDGDERTAPSDQLALINSLNGVTPRPIYSTDIDRSTVAGPSDITALVDLLNGAGAGAGGTAWLNKTLPALAGCPGGTTPPVNKFVVNVDRVVTNAQVNVRDIAGGTVVDTKSSGAHGTVIDGPTVAGGYTWWRIDYDCGPTGWSAEILLDKYTGGVTDDCATGAVCGNGEQESGEACDTGANRGSCPIATCSLSCTLNNCDNDPGGNSNTVGWHPPKGAPDVYIKSDGTAVCDDPNTPGCNPPINISGVSQEKAGLLTVGGLISNLGATIRGVLRLPSDWQTGYVLTATSDNKAEWRPGGAGPGIIDPTIWQRRVTSNCSGQVMVGINQDGTVICEADDTAGTGSSGVSSVSVNNGLNINQNTGAVTVGLNISDLTDCTNSATNKIYWSGSKLTCGTDQTDGGATGDNLGNHTATQQLQMKDYSIGFGKDQTSTVQKVNQGQSYPDVLKITAPQLQLFINNSNNGKNGDVLTAVQGSNSQMYARWAVPAAAATADELTLTKSTGNQFSIKDLGVTGAKIASAAVTSDKIASAAVTSGRIANDAVTNSKLNLAVTFSNACIDERTSATDTTKTTCDIGEYNFCALSLDNRQLKSGSAVTEDAPPGYCKVYKLSGKWKLDVYNQSHNTNSKITCQAVCF